MSIEEEKGSEGRDVLGESGADLIKPRESAKATTSP
jgi:hypothetical protein